MRDAMLVGLGALLVAVTVFDALLTTLSLAGAGPLTARVSHLAWTGLRRLAGHGPRRHRVLRWSGTVTLAATVAL